MTWTTSRYSWPATASSVAGIALVACTSTPPLPMTSGQTTTTYGGTNSSSSSDDGDPGDVTDDGDPSDPGDVTDDGDTDDPWESGPGPLDIGTFVDMGGPSGVPDGSTCTSDDECSSGRCYVIPFLGGVCGQCNEDADCVDGGCTPPNPFDSIGSFCNQGEAGGGCESDEVCADGLSCSNVFNLLDLIVMKSCGSCQSDVECGDQVCAPLVDIAQFRGQKACIDPNSLPQDSYCDLMNNGGEACASSICSVVDIMGLAEIGACGECNVDADCNGGVCVLGEFQLADAVLLGSSCQ